MTIQYVDFKDVKALDSAITTVIANAVALRVEIQQVAVGILLHAYKHGDYTRAEKLVTGLGAGVRGKALVDWFVSMGGLVVGETAEGKKGFSGWQGKEFIKAHIDEAKSKEWWTFKPEPPFAGFDMEQEVEKLIKRAETMMTKANDLRHAGKSDEAAKIVVPVEKLDALRKLRAA